jgi:putative ABC transport system permease protein
MGTLLHDTRFAVRILLNNPGLALVAVVALALGIGANTAIFSVVNTVLLRPLPYKDPDRLVWIWASSPTRNIPFHFFQYPDFVDWRQQARSFESMSAYFPAAATLTGPGGQSHEPEWVYHLRVNASFFHMLGVRRILGRDFVEADDRPGAARVTILSHGLWQRRFGASNNVIGTAITLEGETYTVVGILPQGVQAVNMPAQLYTPIALGGSRTGPERTFSHGAFARLKSDVTLKQAQAETNTIVDRLDQDYFRKGKRGIRLWGVREFLVRDVRLSLLILLGAVALVLLIACANVANLLLAKAVARQKEIAIRTALGAGRWRLVRQLLTESLVLALLGGGLGLLLAYWGVDVLVATTPANYPLVRDTRLDTSVLCFTVLASLLTGLIFGLVPALSVSRTDVHEALKEGGRGSAESMRRNRFRNLLVVTEVALALVLAIGAGLLLKGFLRLQEVNPGFNAKGVLAASISLPAAKYRTPQQRAAFFEEFFERLESLPGVKAAGMVDALPLSGVNRGSNIHIEGRPEPRPDESPTIWMRCANRAYLRTLEIPLLRGRHFTDQDSEAAPRVAIINQTMARQFWPNEDALGKRFGRGLTHRPSSSSAPPPPWITVVGVAGDVRHTALARPPEAEFIVPYAQFSQPVMSLVIRTASDPARFAPGLRSAAVAVDRDQPVSEVGSLEQRLYNSIAPQRLAMRLLGIFAGVAVALAAVGVYGVISFAVTRRTHEIGIRMALGATRPDVLRMVLREGLTMTLSGLGLGLVAALLLTRLLRSLLYGMTASDPLVFTAVPLLLVAVALAACYIPARRATKVDPMVALRYE